MQENVKKIFTKNIEAAANRLQTTVYRQKLDYDTIFRDDFFFRLLFEQADYPDYGSRRFWVRTKIETTYF